MPAGQMPPQAPPGAMPPQGQPPAPGGGGDQEMQAMQQMYDMLVGQTVDYIYGQGLESIKKRIQAGAEDGVEDDVGAVVGQLLLQNWQSAREAQKMIPPKVVAGACKELVEVVTDIAVEMQLIQPQQADAAADEALYAAMATFGQGAKDMSPQERQEYQQLIQELEAEEAQAKGGGMPQQPPGGAPAPQQPPMPAGGQMPR